MDRKHCMKDCTPEAMAKKQPRALQWSLRLIENQKRTPFRQMMQDKKHGWWYPHPTGVYDFLRVALNFENVKML